MGQSVRTMDRNVNPNAVALGPRAPKISSKSCSFQAILGEKTLFRAYFRLRAPLGSKLHWAPLTKMLDMCLKCLKVSWPSSNLTLQCFLPISAFECNASRKNDGFVLQNLCLMLKMSDVSILILCAMQDRPPPPLNNKRCTSQNWMFHVTQREFMPNKEKKGLGLCWK